MLPAISGRRSARRGLRAVTVRSSQRGATPTAFAPGDWKDAVDATLALVRRGRIVVLQNYLKASSEVARRRYLLANYQETKPRHFHQLLEAWLAR